MKYFKISEFDSKLEKGSGKNMKKSTLDKLEKAREIYDKRISINSAFRVEADYQRIKSQGFEISRNSSHFLGYAVDLRPTELDAFIKCVVGCWISKIRDYARRYSC